MSKLFAPTRRDPRFRIEHCTKLNDNLIARRKARGAIPTPFSSYVYYHAEKMRFCGAERLKRSAGTITAGKLADLVVLGRDPFREPPSTLVTLPVERTMLGGHWSFES
jgi:predicted amidohydrolase YtcJ